jgi:hypothetical protein
MLEDKCPALVWDVPDNKNKCYIIGKECPYMCKSNCLDYKALLEHKNVPKVTQTDRRRR